MTPEEKALLWMGGTNFFDLGPGKEYYSLEALPKTMALYNDTLTDVCRARGVECVDIASALPRTSEVFYDDAHYTELGASLVADRSSQYLLSTEPLSEMRP